MKTQHPMNSKHRVLFSYPAIKHIICFYPPPWKCCRGQRRQFYGKRFKGKDSPYRNRLSVTAANIPATRHTKADSDNAGQGLQILAQGKWWEPSLHTGYYLPKNEPVSAGLFEAENLGKRWTKRKALSWRILFHRILWKCSGIKPIIPCAFHFILHKNYLANLNAPIHSSLPHRLLLWNNPRQQSGFCFDSLWDRIKKSITIGGEYYSWKKSYATQREIR